MSRWGRLVVGALVAALSGCVTHVQLPRAPGAEASRSARVRFYRRHRVHTETRGLGRSEQYPIGLVHEVLLNNRQRVEAAEDLSPLVAADSTTARAGQRAADFRTATLAVRGVTFASIVAGAACLFGGVFARGPTAGTTFFICGGASLGVALTAGGTSIATNAAVLVAGNEAFEAYDRDLQAQLRIRMNPAREVLVDRAAPRAIASEVLVDTTAPPVRSDAGFAQDAAADSSFASDGAVDVSDAAITEAGAR
jgi:hypothetical protein